MANPYKRRRRWLWWLIRALILAVLAVCCSYLVITKHVSCTHGCPDNPVTPESTTGGTTTGATAGTTIGTSGETTGISGTSIGVSGETVGSSGSTVGGEEGAGAEGEVSGAACGGGGE